MGNIDLRLPVSIHFRQLFRLDIQFPKSHHSSLYKLEGLAGEPNSGDAGVGLQVSLSNLSKHGRVERAAAETIFLPTTSEIRVGWVELGMLGSRTLSFLIILWESLLLTEPLSSLHVTSEATATDVGGRRQHLRRTRNIVFTCVLVITGVSFEDCFS